MNRLLLQFLFRICLLLVAWQTEANASTLRQSYACRFLFVQSDLAQVDFSHESAPPISITQLSDNGVYKITYNWATYVLRLGGGFNQDLVGEQFISKFFDIFLPGRNATPQMLNKKQKIDLSAQLEALNSTDSRSVARALRRRETLAPIAHYYPSDPKPNSVVSLMDFSLDRMLTQLEPSIAQRAWNSLRLNLTFTEASYLALSDQTKFYFLSEYLRYVIPKTLLRDLGEVLVLRIIAGDNDFHYENWSLVNGRVVTYDLSMWVRISDRPSRLESETSNPFNLWMRTTFRLYLPEVSDEFVESLAAIDEQMIRHVGKLTAFHVYDKMIRGIIWRRDEMVKLIKHHKHQVYPALVEP